MDSETGEPLWNLATGGVGSNAGGDAVLLGQSVLVDGVTGTDRAIHNAVTMVVRQRSDGSDLLELPDRATAGLMSGDLFFYASPDQATGGRVVSIDAAAGETRWTTHMPDDLVPVRLASASDAIFVDARCQNVHCGRVFALDPDTGAIRWEADVEATAFVFGSNTLPRLFLAGPDHVVSDRVVLDAKTGSVLGPNTLPWRDQDALSAPALVGGTVYGWSPVEGQGSVLVADRDLYTRPPSPPPPTVVALPGGVADLSWDAPGSDGGSPVTSYIVESTPGELTCTATVRTCRVSGLTPEQSYTFRVRAVNAAGAGPWSGQSTPVLMLPPEAHPPVLPSPTPPVLDPCPGLLAPPPGPIGLSIDRGAQYTNSPRVTLDVVWPNCTPSFLVSNDGGFRQAQRREVSGQIPWALDSSGPERLPKTVYLRFGDTPVNFTDDIILDQTAPLITSATAVMLGGASSQQVQVATQRGPAPVRVRVQLRAADRNSGVAAMQIADNRRRPGPAVAYRPNAVVQTRASVVFARVRDRAGNWSAWSTIGCFRPMPNRAQCLVRARAATNLSVARANAQERLKAILARCRSTALARRSVCVRGARATHRAALARANRAYRLALARIR